MSDKHTTSDMSEPENSAQHRSSAKQMPNDSHPPEHAHTPHQTTQSPPAQPQSTAGSSATQTPEEQLKAKCDEYLAGWQRARADYQNLQKETERRITEIIQYSNEEFIRELLPTVDHFNYAFKGIPPEERSKGWVKGIEHIQTNMFKTLESHGVQRIPTVGQPFNPELHESVEEVSAEGEISGASGTVIEEVSAGFTLNGKVIQHAKVKVIK